MKKGERERGGEIISKISSDMIEGKWENFKRESTMARRFARITLFLV